MNSLERYLDAFDREIDNFLDQVAIGAKNGLWNATMGNLEYIYRPRKILETAVGLAYVCRHPMISGRAIGNAFMENPVKEITEIAVSILTGKALGYAAGVVVKSEWGVKVISATKQALLTTEGLVKFNQFVKLIDEIVDLLKTFKYNDAKTWEYAGKIIKMENLLKELREHIAKLPVPDWVKNIIRKPLNEMCDNFEAIKKSIKKHSKTAFDTSLDHFFDNTNNLASHLTVVCEKIDLVSAAKLAEAIPTAIQVTSTAVAVNQQAQKALINQEIDCEEELKSELAVLNSSVKRVLYAAVASKGGNRPHEFDVEAKEGVPEAGNENRRDIPANGDNVPHEPVVEDDIPDLCELSGEEGADIRPEAEYAKGKEVASNRENNSQVPIVEIDRPDMSAIALVEDVRIIGKPDEIKLSPVTKNRQKIIYESDDDNDLPDFKTIARQKIERRRARSVKGFRN